MRMNPTYKNEGVETIEASTQEDIKPKKQSKVLLLLNNMTIPGTKQYWSSWRICLILLVLSLLMNWSFYANSPINVKQFRGILGALFLTLSFIFLPVWNIDKKGNLYWKSLKYIAGVFLYYILTGFCIIYWFEYSKTEWFIDLLFICLSYIQLNWTIKVLVKLYQAIAKFIDQLRADNSNEGKKKSNKIQKIIAFLTSVTAFLASIVTLIEIVKSVLI